MRVLKTDIPGVLIVEPDLFFDERGFLFEVYHKNRYYSFGIDTDFVQDNYSFSSIGTLRGLHYQIKNSQAKLIQIIKGEIFDVAVDLRYGSQTFGKWIGTYLSEKNHRQLFIPEGFAHGFCVTSDSAMLVYKCSDHYNIEDEEGVIWSDPEINISWPTEEPILSEKDKTFSTLKEIPIERLPQINTLLGRFEIT